MSGLAGAPPPEREEIPRLVGIGSMVVDRLHRVPRLIGAEEKAVLRRMDAGGFEERRVGGVLLNQLGWAAVLGLRVGIFGKQADDEGGRFLRAAMDRLGIARQLELDGSASSFADIFVDDAGGRAIYMASAATAETTSEHVRTHHADWVRGAGRVSTEISQLPLAAVREVQRLARQAGVPVVLDVDVPPSDAVPGLGDRASLDAALRAADLLKPARAAAMELAPDAGPDALGLARALRKQLDVPAVVVTDGEVGSAVAVDGVELEIPAYPARQVLDTTGAGDAFLGGLLAGLEHGLGWKDAAKLGSACGTACVEKLGAFPDDPATARTRVLELYDGAPLALGAAPAAEAGSDTGRSEALHAFDVALAELGVLRERLGGAAFDQTVALVREAERQGGRVHVTGVGKPEHVAHYAASVLSSTGTPATFLHATEAVHGSAGQVARGDVVVAISNSGETGELLRTVEAVKTLGARVVAVTGAPHSLLARAAETVLDAGVAREGGGLGFAPRASVAAEILVLAALSAALEVDRGFTRADYHARHPAGALGRRSGGSTD